MRYRFVKLIAVVVALVATSTACDDRIIGSEAGAGPEPYGPALALASDSVDVQVLKRTLPLLLDVSASAVIGSSGGTITVPDAGLKVIFPRGALAANTTITVTAYAGDLVAYGFEPHGITFGKTVVAEQALQGTEASNKTDFSSSGRGYFGQKSDVDWLLKTAKVTELQPVELLQTKSGNKLKFYMDHFSGYLVSIGRI